MTSCLSPCHPVPQSQVGLHAAYAGCARWKPYPRAARVVGVPAHYVERLWSALLRGMFKKGDDFVIKAIKTKGNIAETFRATYCKPLSLLLICIAKRHTFQAWYVNSLVFLRENTPALNFKIACPSLQRALPTASLVEVQIAGRAMAAEPLMRKHGHVASVTVDHSHDSQDFHFVGEILGNFLVTWRSDQWHQDVYAHVPSCYICKASFGPRILQTRHLLNIDGVNSVPPSNISHILTYGQKCGMKSLWSDLVLSFQSQSSQCMSRSYLLVLRLATLKSIALFGCFQK